MELSKRMQMVADLVTPGSRIADIGTDHAYIPIFLVRTEISPEALAMDVKEGPLRRAEENIEGSGLKDRIRIRLSDGLAALEPGEADAVILAGMGGNLMIRILREAERTVSGLKECILQPQSDIEKVRAFLLEKGFFFISEEMTEDDGKYYFAMKVRPPEETGMHPVREEDGSWTEEELRYGKLLLRRRDPLLRIYLEREKKIRREILKKTEGRHSDRTRKRAEEIRKELDCIERALEYYTL